MKRAAVEHAHDKALQAYCIVGLLKELANSREDDACLAGTLETLEGLMDHVTSVLHGLVEEHGEPEPRIDFAEPVVPVDTTMKDPKVVSLFEWLKQSIAKGELAPPAEEK